jgi:hypothetical protein
MINGMRAKIQGAGKAAYINSHLAVAAQVPATKANEDQRSRVIGELLRITAT